MPAVVVDRGWVEKADSNLAQNSHKLTGFKDVKDKMFKKHGDDSEEQHIHGETHNKSSYPSWWKSRSRNGLLTFLNNHDEFMEEVTSAAVPDSVHYQVALLQPHFCLNQKTNNP